MQPQHRTGAGLGPRRSHFLPHRHQNLARLAAILGALLLLFGAASAWAGVVFEQVHDGSGTLRMSSRFQANGTDYDQFVWDAWSVPTAQAITEIRWRGGYDPGMAPWAGTIVNFHVSIYESIAALSEPYLGPGYPQTPATLAAYDTGGKAGETNAGSFNGLAMYDYHFVLPTVFQAEAGKLYWVQIEAEFANGLPSWGLAAATGAGSHFRRIPGQADYYFQIISGDTAFSIVAGDGPIYTIAATASPIGSGFVANAGLYPAGSAAPLVATPAVGYAFMNWTEDGTVVSSRSRYSFTVTADRTLVANFAPGSIITTSASPATGGTTNGDGSYANGSSVTVQATPSANYVFVNWTENGAAVSTSATYTFTVAADRNLVANFASAATNLGIVFNQPPTSSGTLLLSSYLAPDGNVDGMEYRFEKFAIPGGANISHLHWRGGYVGNNRTTNPVVEFVIKFYGSTANGYYPDLANPYLKKYTVAGNASETFAGVYVGVELYDYDVTLPTSFSAAAGVPYWIQIEASQYGYPLTWGNTTGRGGDNGHYRKYGNNYYSGSGDLALTLSADVPTTYAIGAVPSSANGGSTSGEGMYALGAAVNLSATANAGYAFVNWTEANSIVSSSPVYSFAANADRTLVANFQPVFTLALSSSSTTMGTVSGGGTFLVGSSVSAVATAKAGYVFLNWTDGSNVVSTSPAYSFTLLASRSLRANFAAGFTVTAGSSFGPGGSVSGAGGYVTGSPVSLVATPATGYSFTGWSEGGTIVSNSTSLSFPANTNRTLVANFVPIVTMASSAPGTLSIAWPASAAGWRLEESHDLTPGSWVNSSLAIATSGSDSTATIANPGGTCFYRLVRP